MKLFANNMQRWRDFRGLDRRDRRRAITELIINNSLYILLFIAIIFIGIRSPKKRTLYPNIVGIKLALILHIRR